VSEQYTPKHLKLWTWPENYAGAEWPDYYVFLCRHSDCDRLLESNYRSGLRALKEIPEPDDWPHDFSPYEEILENHWAVGWVEWIGIHKDAIAHLKCADEIAGKLENYPIIDEDDFSQLETDEANDMWLNCYSWKERIKYIRDNRSQFSFQSFSDLLQNVRGKYFSGYASDLLS